MLALRNLCRFDDVLALEAAAVAVLVGGEVFVVAAHPLPGRVAVLTRQLGAGRLRPPPHLSAVTITDKAGKAVGRQAGDTPRARDFPC